MNDDSYGQCGCGSAWFRLEDLDDVPDEPGPIAPAAVCISECGVITGYSGMLVCVDCDKSWDPRVRFKPTGSHLRIVR